MWSGWLSVLVVILLVIASFSAGAPTNSPASTNEGSDAQKSFALLWLFFILIICFAMAYFLRTSRFEYFHESGAAILIGGIFGFITRYLLTGSQYTAMVQFDRNFFFVFLLPPIIFESGFSMEKGVFFGNLASILVFAFLGTIITAGVFGGILFLFAKIGIMSRLSLVECMLFGSIISATDPVSTLAIFKAMRVDPDLYSNVFGESVLNDAVAIVLFRTVSSFITQDLTRGTLIAAALQFLLVFFGSFLIGVGIALLSSLMLKYVALSEYPQLEMAIMVIFAYSSYLIAEGFALSGIVAILFCGIATAHYTYRNLSRVSKALSSELFGLVAFICETLVFAWLGLGLFGVEQRYDIVLALLGLLACLVARAVEVYPLSAAINLLRSKRIPLNQQHMLWFSGLRGAIAFSLALYVPTPHGDVLLTSTLVIVLVSVVFLGGGTTSMLRLLRIRTGVEPRIGEDSYENYASFDERYIVPIFVSEAAREAEERQNRSHSFSANVDSVDTNGRVTQAQASVPEEVSLLSATDQL